MKTNYLLNAMSVGGYVNSEHFEKATVAFQQEYPGLINSVTVKKNIILKALNSHESITGIRFMYGLDDSMNPNSLRVFLIPCTHISENLSLSKPLVAKTGYYNHTGNINILTDVVTSIAAYVKQMVNMNSTLVYKEVTRGSFLGKNALLDLVSTKNCEFVSIHFGLEGKILKPVFVPVDAKLQPIEGLYMNFTSPCPNACGSDDTCITELSVTKFSLNEELNVYRNFRDTILLNIENGEEQYEMYYFISPLITTMISESVTMEEELEDIYYQKIVPFRQLLTSNKYDEANEWLKQTFEEWVAKWQVSLVV